MPTLVSTRGQNIGAIARLQIAPIEYLNGLPDEADYLATVGSLPTLKAGKEWLTIVPETESVPVEQPIKDTRNGDLHDFSLEMSINLIEPSKMQLLKKYKYHRLAVLLTDNNDVQYLVGNKYHGATLRYEPRVEEAIEGKSYFLVSLTAENPAGMLAVDL